MTTEKYISMKPRKEHLKTWKSYLFYSGGVMGSCFVFKFTAMLAKYPFIVNNIY